VFGELLDLQAGELLGDEVDAAALVARIEQRYDDLWRALTGVEEFSIEDMWRIEQRVERLNGLGFDVDEIDIVTDWDGASIRIQPKVVEAEHHARRLQGLTGLDVEESQARRLLNDLDAYAAAHGLQAEEPMIVAHRWLTEVFEALRAMIPQDLRGVVEPAELYHDVLVHRWYLSERAGQEVDFFEAARSYIDTVLPGRAATVSAAETSPLEELSVDAADG